MDFKSKTVTREKEGHYIRMKRSVHQEIITIININAPNIRVPKYIWQIITDITGILLSKISQKSQILYDLICT